MKNCPNCGAQIEDSAEFCQNCGAQFVRTPVYVDPFDHTAEFDPKDISENKVFAMLAYLTGIIGVIIALLASRESKFAGFHIRQILRFTVIEILMWVIAALTFWLFFIPIIVAAVFECIFFVIKIICFFQVCKGQAKEAAIIRSFKFLK